MKKFVLQAAAFVAIAVTVSGCYTRVEDHPVAAASPAAPAVVVAPRPAPNTVIVQP